jgi:hypothetical protein
MADAGIDNATHLMPPLQAREPSVRAYDVSRLGLAPSAGEGD